MEPTPPNSDHRSRVDEVSVFLVEFLRKNLPEDLSANLTNHTQLFETGILSSMRIGQLLGYVRNELGVEIPIERIDHDSFQDLESLAGLVTQLLAE